MRIAVLATALGCCIIGVSVADPAIAAATRKPTNIPPQELALALQALARDRDFQIVCRADLLKDRRSSAVSGELTPYEALARLLTGTGLTYRALDDQTITIVPMATRPVSESHDTAAGSAPVSPESTGTDNDNRLEEVRVTARRRSEIQTEVPISITAYSSDFLQKQNIRSFTDFATRTPNVTFQYGGDADGFSEGRVTTIRGIAGQNTTALYINDTPVPAAVTPQTLNLERMEVLKGPQGTLFGASSMGGNLRFITREPSLIENSVTTQFGTGITERGGPDVDANARASVVLVPRRLAMDLTGGYTRESGFITRRFPDGSGNLVSKDGQGRNDTYAASISLRAAITGRLEASVSARGQTSDLHGWPAAYVPLPDYRPLSYTMDRDRDVQEYTKDRWGLGALVLKYNGDTFSITSSTSYFDRRVREQADSTEGADSFIQDAFGVDLGSPPIPVISRTETGQFTQETRLAFDKGAIAPKLSGVFGVFYQHKNVSRGSPEVDIPALRESGLYEPGFLGAYTSHGLETQTALFGEAYYEVVPKLTVSLGLRQYWIKQSVGEYPEYGLIVGGETIVPAISNKDSGAVPKAVVSYEIGDRGTLYASAAKGFRVGGAQQELPAICDQDLQDLGFSRSDTRSFKPDNLWSYEVGAKNNFAAGSLAVSAAAFQIDWNQIQQNVVLPACTFSFIGNAGKARIRGGELELSGRPITEMPLTLQLGIGYSQGTLVDPGLIPQPANTRLVQVPEWTPSLSGYYEVPISNSTRLFAAADYSYTSSVKVADGQGNFVTRQPFNLVNGNIGVRFGETEIRAYVRNLLDKRLNYGDLIGAGFERQKLLSDGTYQRYPEGAVSRPRQIGVQVRKQF